MWSVWSESVDVYLGQGVAMLKVGQQQSRVFQHPATMPLQRVLAMLAQAMPSNKQRRDVRLTLSGALCPAIAFSAPPTVTNWQELRQIATASAGVMLGTSTDQIACETDRLGSSPPGVAAAVNTALLTELQSWAAAQRLRITSLMPLWAVASGSVLAKRPGCSGLLLQEPDSMTALVCYPTASADANAQPIAATLVDGVDQSAATSAGLSASARRWLVGLGLTEGALLKLNFSTQAGASLHAGPKVWISHWSTHWPTDKLRPEGTP